MKKVDRKRGTPMALLLCAGLSAACASAAHADWRKDLGTFRIGISATDAKSLSPVETGKMSAGYAAALGMPVEIVVLRDYPALIDAQVSSRIEYAIYTAILLCRRLAALRMRGAARCAGSDQWRDRNAQHSGHERRGDFHAAGPERHQGWHSGPRFSDRICSAALPNIRSARGRLLRMNGSSTYFRAWRRRRQAFAEGRIDGFFGWTYADADGPIKGSGIMGRGSDAAFSVNGKTVETKVPWTSNSAPLRPACGAAQSWTQKRSPLCGTICRGYQRRSRSIY